MKIILHKNIVSIVLIIFCLISIFVHLSKITFISFPYPLSYSLRALFFHFGKTTLKTAEG
jgi:hypothetical protein